MRMGKVTFEAPLAIASQRYPAPGPWAAESVHGEKWPRRGLFLPNSQANSLPLNRRQ
ncbi:hypothetical protein [Polaromonas sp. CG9_12]|nr:hypothetical protein [Polaromonas sp. CG9_12]